jgi:hypothetical protein
MILPSDPLVVPQPGFRSDLSTREWDIKERNLSNKKIHILPVYVRVSLSTVSGKTISFFEKH